MAAQTKQRHPQKRNRGGEPQGVVETNGTTGEGGHKATAAWEARTLEGSASQTPAQVARVHQASIIA